MMKEFGMKPDEVDKLDANFVESAGILLSAIRKEEERHARG